MAPLSPLCLAPGSMSLSLPYIPLPRLLGAAPPGLPAGVSLGFPNPICTIEWNSHMETPPLRMSPLPSLLSLPLHPSVSLGHGSRVSPVWGRSPGPPPHTQGWAPAAIRAAEPQRRVGAVRSHLPLIEFICYNPKQCKAGFSQAPAAWLPIKIPSRTANPPSRLDIKQPVSTKRQAQPPHA